CYVLESTDARGRCGGMDRAWPHGTEVASGATDASGQIVFDLPPGTYYVTTNALPRQVGYETTVTITSTCVPYGVTQRLAAAPGYVVGPCPLPIKDTLNVTSSVGDGVATYHD